MWPPVMLPNTSYYISLYFQDNRTPSPYSWRVFDVSLNGREFFINLNATTNGVTVYSTQWPLSGQTEIVLTPADGMPVGPLINAGEVFQIVPLGGRTLTRDGNPLSQSHFHLSKAKIQFFTTANMTSCDWNISLHGFTIYTTFISNNHIMPLQ